MSVDPTNLQAILVMAFATYATRIAGLWVARILRPGPVVTAALDAMPVAVLTAVIMPGLVKGGIADMTAGAITVLAATRLPMLATCAVGMASVVVLRSLLAG